MNGVSIRPENISMTRITPSKYLRIIANHSRTLNKFRHKFLFFMTLLLFLSYFRPVDADAFAFHATEPGHLPLGELVDGSSQL